MFLCCADFVQETAPERISGSVRVCDLFHCKSRYHTAAILAVKICSFAAKCNCHNFHALAVQCFCCFPDILMICQKFCLLIRNLHKIHIGNQASHMLLRCLFIRPQRCTVIGIVRNHAALVFCSFYRIKRGISCRLIRQGQGSNMKNMGMIQHIHIHFFLLDLRIRSRFSCKRESPLSSLADFHKSQCSKIIFVQEHTLGIHVFFLKNRFQELSVHIFSCFTDKCSMSSQSTGCNCNIGWCTARISGIQHLSILIDILRCKIDQDLTKGCDIIDGSFHSISCVHNKVLIKQLKKDLLAFFLIICMYMKLSLVKLRHT